MHMDFGLSAPPVAADHAALPVARQLCRLRVAALFNTTALLIAAGPKLPPYQGD